MNRRERLRTILSFKYTVATIKDILGNRTVLSAMIKRNTAGRYKSSALGFLWNMLYPLLTMLVLYIVFMNIRTRPIPEFWIYLCQGMFPVTFLSGCLRGRAVINSASYITKMKFPREIAVISDAFSQIISTVIVYLIVIIIILSNGQPMDWSAAAMIAPMLVLMFFFGVGCSFILSTICVFVKDMGHFLAIAMRGIMWLTPTFFMANEVKGALNIIWYNPLTYFVECFHDIIYFGRFPNVTYVLICIGLTAVVLVIGWLVFQYYKPRFPEVL